MLTVSELSLNFSGTDLFKDVNIQFTAGNCYGVIGANGAGKSTFLKILAGQLDPSKGQVSLDPKARMSVLKQDHFAYDEFSVLDTVFMGNARLYQVLKQKDALYAKEDFTNEDGILTGELEGEFAELGGWEAESDISRLLQGLGLPIEIMDMQMAALPMKQKVKVLLAQALFGNPDLILLDEPTNHLDAKSITWLEDFFMDYPGTIIVVSHDRHFLNNICTHIVDIDYNKIKVYVGNYDFWYESSQLFQRMLREQNKKMEEKAKEYESFIQRFSANKSKSRQATSRKKLLEKLTLDDLPTSSRSYPFVGFTMERKVAKDILTVEGISKTIDGVKVLNDVSFMMNSEDKIAFVGENEVANTTLFEILLGNIEPDSGSFKWGVTTSQSYLPLDNSSFFETTDLNLIQWLAQYSKDQSEIFLRGFLGKMLFSGDDVFKQVKVLSGGEKVRCMLARMMLFGSNVLVADQPTNHLDLESITAVNNGFCDFKGNILFSSHDHQLLQSVANRIILLTPTGLIDNLGTYEEFLEKHGDKI